MLTCKSFVTFHSACFPQVKRMIGGIGNMLCTVYFQTEKVLDPVLTLVEPLKHVITLRGQILLSCVVLCVFCRCVLCLVSLCVLSCVVVWHAENPRRVYTQNVSVCTGTTRACLKTCARGAGTHGAVLNGQCKAHGHCSTGDSCCFSHDT